MSNRGWLFSAQDAPLELADVPAPVPGEGQVVIDVAAAGLCHSDIGIIAGPGAAWITNLPIVLGHEVSGTVRQLGPGVTEFSVGDRVAIGLLAHGPERKSGWEAPGLSRNGGYEQQAIAEVNELVAIPDGVDFAQAAAATDSVTTAYHAVTAVGEVTTGTVVGIIGLGGLGLNAVQVALAAGATVHGVDITAGARARARDFGAASVHEQVSELAQFNPDVIFDFAGFGDTTATAIEVVRGEGTVVVVGLGKLEATISTNSLVTKNVRVLGSSGGSKDDLKTVLGLIANGTITNTLEMLPFDKLPEGIERLMAGGLTGRLVLDVAAG